MSTPHQSSGVLGESSAANVERDPESPPDLADLSGRCPRCGNISTFTQHSHPQLLNASNTMSLYAVAERVVTIQCAYCQKLSVVIERKPQASYDFRGIHWWPAPGAAELPQEVPADVTNAYNEGMRCLGAQAPNGAVAMFRAALTFIIDDKGSAGARAQRDLKDKIKQLARDGGPLGGLVDWMDDVRLYGNAGAHPDLWGDVSMAEASDVAKLTYTIVEMLYITPAKIAARRASRSASRPTS